MKVRKGMSYVLSVKVGVHKGPVLSPFLFAIVTNVVCGDVMDGLLFEVLCANDLVFMAESMEGLRLKFDRWKSVIEKQTRVLCIGCQKWVHKRCSGVKVGLRSNLRGVSMAWLIWRQRQV